MVNEQPVLDFDAVAARDARDAALEHVSSSAEDFIDAAVLAIERVARRCPLFIVDEVWRELGDVTTPEKRAMGAAMQRAHHARLIAPTQDFQASTQVQCHANPRRVWRSLVWA
jgi:hypothetical protein